MQIQWTDFNGADLAIQSAYSNQWNDVEQVLTSMPLHLKASDQNGLQGNPIFDPVGTNNRIAYELVDRGWQAGLPIPPDLRAFGKDVDVGKQGMLVEVQFSNYPFLLNNTFRSELFYRNRTSFGGWPLGVIVIVTKSGRFPSSNSTLYYEQGLAQLSALAIQGLFTVPLRLVGLFENSGPVPVTWTGYSEKRYSRTIGTRDIRTFEISHGDTGKYRISPPEDDY